MRDQNQTVKIVKVHRGYIIQSYKEEYSDNDPIGPGDYYPKKDTRIYESFEKAIEYLYSHFGEKKGGEVS